MKRATADREIVRELNLAGLPEGEILKPMERVPETERALHEAWECPLSPWGGFSVGSGMSISSRGGRNVLSMEPEPRWERALVARGLALRDGRIRAEIIQTRAEAVPNDDRNDVSEALAGVVFRWENARRYYQFALEGRRRAVLLRRCDDEWDVLAEQAVTLPDGFVTLEIDLSGDGIRCRCDELGVEFFETDTMFRSGKLGMRSHGGAEFASFRVEQSAAEQARDAAARAREQAAEAVRGENIPDAILKRTYTIADLGGQPVFHDYIVPGRYDLLVEGERCLRALTEDGEVIWETDEPIRRCVFSREFVGHGRLIYGFAGLREANEGSDVSGAKKVNTIDDEMVVLHGDTGKIVAREKLPEAAPKMQMFDWSPTSVAFSSDEPTDVVLREWRRDRGCQGGGLRLWAYDRDLNLLWHHEQTGAHYGHHYALEMFDIDGDGRDELLAGGYMYGADGSVRWVHDRADEMMRIEAGRHYDAVLLGNLAGNAEEDPTAFLISSSAGVYVVDALTGETRATHRIGHAQGGSLGKVRPDLPGTEALIATRWGNYGILTLFSGRGERLWTIQPDYVGQGATAVTWGSEGHRLIWTNTSAQAQALWDGHGNLVKRLPALSETWGNRMSREVGRRGSSIRIGTDPAEYLTLTVDGVLHVFGPDE